MFDWRTYIDVAKTISQLNGEANARCAVSRAYYAAFNIARRWLEKDNPRHYSIIGPNDHNKIWQYFTNDGGMVMKPIGVYGTRLRIFRNQVDYEDTVPRLMERVHDAIKDAEEIIQLVGRL